MTTPEKAKPTFRLKVLSLVHMLFDGDVESVYLNGDEGEYELLPYHFPLVGALPEGEIKLRGKKGIPLRAGVVLFDQNKCTILIEEMPEGETDD